jgi:hypothetical protein
MPKQRSRFGPVNSAAKDAALKETKDRAIADIAIRFIVFSR